MKRTKTVKHTKTRNAGPQVVYKVVRKTNDPEVFSSCSPPLGCYLFYKRGKTTKPVIPHSRIFAFRSLKAARKFSCTNGTFRIFRSTAWGVLPLRYRMSIFATPDEVETFWKYPECQSLNLRNLDQGISCSSLKITRDVTFDRTK